MEAGHLSGRRYAVCVTAVENLRRISREHLYRRFRIEVVDQLERPGVARGEGIVLVPTLERKRPLPEKKIFGSLAAAGAVMSTLEMPNPASVERQQRPR